MYKIVDKESNNLYGAKSYLEFNEIFIWEAYFMSRCLEIFEKFKLKQWDTTTHLLELWKFETQNTNSL